MDAFVARRCCGPPKPLPKLPRRCEPKATRATLCTLLSVSCLNLLSFTAMFPMTPKLMKRYEVQSDLGVGLVASSFALGRFFTTSLWPLLSDHLGRRKVLFLALLGGAVGSALQGLAIACRWPFGAFLVLRGAAGMCSGIVPTLKAYIVDAFEPEDVPKVLAYREAAGTASFVLGPLLGGLLAAHVLSAPLFFSAAASAFAAALCLAVLPEPRKRRRGPRRPGGAVRRAAPIFALSFAWACTRTCFHSYFPLLLTRRFALPLEELGLVLTSISFLVAVVQVAVFEPCRQRYGLQRTMQLGVLLVIIGLCSLVLWPIGSSLPEIILSAAVYGAGSALVAPALPALLVGFASENRTGALLGLDSLIVNGGRIVAPSIFGLLLFSNYARLCLFPAKLATVTCTAAFVALLTRRL